jgi:tRNA (cmo5U34)-methyltransferase
MTSILLAERVPRDAHILVLGAGGGLELKALAEAQPGWTFTGVDPAPEMLKLAGRTLGPLKARVHLIEGLIDVAPDGPFDAAVCLLTLHFLGRDERVRTIGEVHRRLKAAAPFVAAHFSFPQGDRDRALWLSRYAAFAVASGGNPADADKMRAGIEDNLVRFNCLFSPDEDAAMLSAGGFSGVTPFYAAFTWRGWVAYA